MAFATLRFRGPALDLPAAEQLGLKFGDRGTHSSRTMMLEELGRVCQRLPAEASRQAITNAIIEDNLLLKQTASTRRLSSQRLAELYGLDPGLPIYRVLRRLWTSDPLARPQVALLVALARDPLLLATASAVFGKAPGEIVKKDDLRATLQLSVGDRFNVRTLDKIARNAASSWTQAGHLQGRVRKVRSRFIARPASMAMALWLGSAAGFSGTDLFQSGWTAVLDCTPVDAQSLALDAKRCGLIDLLLSGNVVDIGFDRLDPPTGFVGRGN